MPDQAKLTVVAVTYGQMPNILPRFVYDYLAQTDQNYNMVVLHDGHSSDGTREFMESICRKFPNFSYFESEERQHYPEKNEGWGHFNRARGLALVDTEWVWFQNCDNQTIPKAVEILNHVISNNDNIDVVWFNLLHSYTGYREFKRAFANCACDMAQFIVKTELAKEVGFNHRCFIADGLFIEDIKKYKPGLMLASVDNVLTIHN